MEKCQKWVLSSSRQCLSAINLLKNDKNGCQGVNMNKEVYIFGGVDRTIFDTYRYRRLVENTHLLF